VTARAEVIAVPFLANCSAVMAPIPAYSQPSFSVDCRYCGASSVLIGVTAKQYWVSEWATV
jgi:hypothetical protein